MYVDKRLGGVHAVQTLPRLNRTFRPIKDQTFVLDCNDDVADIADGFSPYNEATTLADVTERRTLPSTCPRWRSSTSALPLSDKAPAL